MARAARLDEHGYVVIADRTKDMIKSGGEWISSVELENLLLDHPDVAEAAVIAVPDPRWRERPLAIVVAEAGSGLADQTDELREQQPCKPMSAISRSTVQRATRTPSSC